MGNDGGTKALMRKYSRWGTKREEAHYEPEEIIHGKWSTCAISGDPLQEPICACELGYLFNKDVILQGLIEKSLPGPFSHIRKLKDIVELHFTINPDYNPKYKGDASNYWQQDILGGKYICPISKETVGSKTKFCYLRPCGCVLAEKVIKEIPSKVCLVCGKPFCEDDVIIINGSEEERKDLEQRMNERRKKPAKSMKRKHEKKNESGKKVKTENKETNV